MDPVVLPANKTFSWRVATFQSLHPRVGVLEIREATAEGRKPKVSRYAAVEEEPEEGFRTFRLTKPSGAAVYHCSIRRQRNASAEDRCTCDGGQGGWCKHQAALRELLEAGRIPRISG